MNIIRSFKNLYQTILHAVHSPHASFVLGLCFFAEAFIPIPADPILMFYCLEERKKAYKFASTALICILLGGITAYSIAYFLWQKLGHDILQISFIHALISEKTFNELCVSFQQEEIYAIFFATLLPLPYYLITLAGGICNLSLPVFVICTALGRGLRYFALACAIKTWGATIKQYIDRYFSIFAFLILLLIIVAIARAY